MKQYNLWKYRNAVISCSKVAFSKVSNRIHLPLPADCLSWLSCGDGGGRETKADKGNFHHIISVCQSCQERKELPLQLSTSTDEYAHIIWDRYTGHAQRICDVREDSRRTDVPSSACNIIDNYPVGEKPKVGRCLTDRSGSLTDPHRKPFDGHLPQLNEGLYPCPIVLPDS